MQGVENMKIHAIIIVALLALSSVALADVIMPDTHLVMRCVVIYNISKNNVDLYGYSEFPGRGNGTAAKIEEGSCLPSKGYKFNSYSIYWSGKTGAPEVELGNENLLSTEIDPDGGYVSNAESKANERIEYNLVKENGKFGLVETGRIVDGKMTLPPSAPNPTPEPSPTPQLPPSPQPPAQQRGFFEGILCWISQLFGRKC